MSGFNRKSSSSVLRQSSYNSLYVNPLNDLNQNNKQHIRNSSDGDLIQQKNRNNGSSKRTTLAHQLFGDPNNKENAPPPPPFVSIHSKQNVGVVPLGEKNTNSVVTSTTDASPISKDSSEKRLSISPSSLSAKTKLLKSSSLQLCMQLNEPDSTFGLKLWDPLFLDSDNTNQGNLWDHSDSEAAPASSWSTLPNRYLLCRPLPLDIGRCTCVIVKEALEELDCGSVYSLYTNEGHGRRDRKLAVAHHRRRSGRSEYTVAQNAKGLLCSSDESILGTITANFMGSKYHIWDQGSTLDPLKNHPKLLLAVVGFVPTITTCTGSYRSLRAWIPKHQSVQLKSTSKIQHVNGLPKDWEAKTDKFQELHSRVPNYNDLSKQYELDFRERGRAGLRIQSSVKNFQLTMEDNGRQSILQLGRVGKSKFVMDYRYPLTGYQAFCICLASMDSKLCCTV